MAYKLSIQAEKDSHHKLLLAIWEIWENVLLIKHLQIADLKVKSIF